MIKIKNNGQTILFPRFSFIRMTLNIMGIKTMFPDFIYIDENESVTDRMKDFFSKELWLYLFRNTRVSDMFLMKMNIAKNKRELLSRY